MRPAQAARSTESILPAFQASRRRLTLALLLAFLVQPGTTVSHAQVAPSPASRFVVLLDPAHGGDDSGARLAGSSGDAIAEKDFTLALSVRLRSLLEARGIQVVTTRESDATLSSDQRAQIANHAVAQACLVLHGAMSGAGVHLFLSSLQPSQPARFVPWQAAQASWVTRSVALAGVLNSALLHAGSTVTLGRTALTTVDRMACPAVAIEVAPDSAAKKSSGNTSGLDDAAYQARIAEALAAGLLEWREEGKQP